MSNLLPAQSQKSVRGELRARFLLALALVFLCGAGLSALALAPAEVGLVFFSPPTEGAAQAGIDAGTDNAAAAHTKAVLAAMKDFTATSSMDDVLAALSERGAGIKVNGIAYSVAGRSLTLSGTAFAPSDVNTFRQALETDPRFANVSVPVSALLGSQNGGFTIAMKIIR